MALESAKFSRKSIIGCHVASNSRVIWMLSAKMKIKIVEYFDKTTSKLNEIGSSRSNATTSRQSKQPSKILNECRLNRFPMRLENSYLTQVPAQGSEMRKIMPIEIMQSSALIFSCQVPSFSLHLVFFLFHSLYS